MPEPPAGDKNCASEAATAVGPPHIHDRTFIMANRQRSTLSLTSKPPAVATEDLESSLGPDDVTIVRQDLRKSSSVTERSVRIAHRAYQLAEQRGFEAGHDLDDWLEAERQIEQEHESI
jgi:Protein of unknown function (DUF2934)